ncbi:DUF1592 domain-containing protein [Rubripirellula amarantea]|nr:DUF1592 domain-containing protein [Rubripirellula amarantea]
MLLVRSLLIAVSVCVLSPLRGFAKDSSATQPPAITMRLVERSCIGCHEGPDGEGGLDLTALSTDLSDPNVAMAWVRIHDRVKDGEMPPPDDDELADPLRRNFTRQTAKWISDFQESQFEQFGRVQGRRLTNSELERTLQDLLAIDIPLSRLMTAEPRNDGFIGIADSQSMSHYQMESHIKAVDAALDTAFDRIVGPTSPMVRELPPEKIARKNPKRRCRDPEMRKGLAVTWASKMIFYGRMTSTTSPEDGWYRITFKASGLKPPEGRDVWCTIRSGACVSGDPLMNWIGSFAATKDPAVHVYDAWIPAGHMIEIRPGDAMLKQAKFQGGQVGVGEGEPQNVPGVALHSLKMERIYPKGDPVETRRRLLGDLNVSIDRKKHKIELKSKTPDAALARQLRSFMHSAFRRPVPKNVVNAYSKMLGQAIESGEEPIMALKSTYRAVLCSPRFIYRVEPFEDSSSGSSLLDQYAIANRLAYFLTGTMPDEVLLQLAADGQLSDPNVLHQQVDRLLDDAGRPKFVKDFAAEWLDLMDIDFTEPDPGLYRNYDPVVQNAMLDETHLFLDEMIDKDLPIQNLVRSDFTYLNSRLARHYGIEDFDGNETKRHTLDKSSVRGGLLAHGAIMKVTANGTTTSPVLRGVWVSERILGTEIPPPPENVPAVEPDIRGATTIREQLLKHVDDSQCAACHVKIDPPGYALENFDPAGQWRERYFNRNAKGSNRRPKIDPSFQMPSGEKFEDFNQFRDLVSADTDALARNVVEKLLTYGTGATIKFADRENVETIVKQTKSDRHGMKSLIKAVVTSPTFLSK